MTRSHCLATMTIKQENKQPIGKSSYKLTQVIISLCFPQANRVINSFELTLLHHFTGDSHNYMKLHDTEYGVSLCMGGSKGATGIHLQCIGYRLNVS